MLTPEAILNKYWGYKDFRPLQKEIITDVLDDKDVLALLPTGAGKSICYQIPAINKGLCLVISPLTALMQDQVARLTSLGIDAACLYAGMHINDIKRIMSNAVNDAYKLLYISPERLQTALFNDYLPALPVTMIAVDEAHCISQWGYDFRPDYLKISWLRQVFKKVPVLALTATATNPVKLDIIKQLELTQPAVYKQSYARNNIFYEVKYSNTKNADTLATINAGGSNIIYCRSRRQTESLVKYLQQHAVPALHYHAGMDKKKRAEHQQEWMADKNSTMVATTAFGMGIDKPDVRRVIHYDTPEHLEAYYQEAGRAGRDGRPAGATMLYNSNDIKKLQNSIALKFPEEQYLRQVYQSVCEYLQIAATTQPNKYYDFDLADFCKKFKLETAPATNALRLLGQEDLWTISDAVYNPPAILFISERHVVDRLSVNYPDLFYVTTGLLRLYGTLFHYPTPVRISAIAKQLKLKKENVEALLENLVQMEIIEYIKPREGAQLFFHHYRVDSQHLLIDMQRIYTLKRQYTQQVKAIIDYLKDTTVCRERMLLTYFNENTEHDCRHCDVCRSKYNAATTKPVNLEEEILLLVRQTISSIPQLLKHFPSYEKDKIIDKIRLLADNGRITIDKQNKLSSNNRQ